MPRDEWEKIKHARQREVICRLMIDLMREVHGAYAPKSEPFGTRIEAFFIALCVAIGDLDGRPFSVSKIASWCVAMATTISCSQRHSIPSSASRTTKRLDAN